jgi:hypothetical protein
MWPLYTGFRLRRGWRYQRGNQNPYIEEEQTTQWPKEKGQKNKQWSTKHTHQTKTDTIWRYQRGIQNPQIEEEQTTQCPKEKGQKNKQWSTQSTHKTNDFETCLTLWYLTFSFD